MSRGRSRMCPRAVVKVFAHGQLSGRRSLWRPLWLTRRPGTVRSRLRMVAATVGDDGEIGLGWFGRWELHGGGCGRFGAFLVDHHFGAVESGRHEDAGGDPVEAGAGAEPRGRLYHARPCRSTHRRIHRISPATPDRPALR